MNIRITISILLCIPWISTAQNDYSGKWKDFFSYHKVYDFHIDDSNITALTDRGVFLYDRLTNEYRKISSVNGLSGSDTSSMYFDETNGDIYIGNQNGYLEIIRPGNDIVLKTEIAGFAPVNDKSINHILPYEESLFISTPFGIVVYDTASDSFGDTYFIGEGSSEVYVNECLVSGGQIYAATTQGIYHAQADNPLLVDAAQWTHSGNANFTNLTVFDNQVLASSENTIYQLNGGNLTPVLNMDEPVKDLRVSGGLLLITSQHKVLAVNEVFQNQFQITSSYQPEYYFRANTAQVYENRLYTATENFGILSSPLNALYQFDEIHPPGPSSNKPFSINASNGQLWVVYGGHSTSFAPLQNSRGVDHFDGSNWKHIPFGTDGIPTRDNVDICYAADDPSKVYITSYGDGISVLNNDQLQEWWTPDNSPLESWQGVSYSPVRVSGGVIDETGNLWVAQVAVDHLLKKYDPGSGEWELFNLSQVVPDITGLGDLIIDHSGNIWISSYTMGAIVYNKYSGKKTRLTTQINKGDLPDNYVRSLAVDRENRIWIGTNLGLVVFNSSPGFFDTSFNAAPIVIDYGEDDEFGEALLGEQSVNSICVDGADTKWFGTNEGVLHTGTNGKTTLHLFNTMNSPLPSNRILKIDFDPDTGLVYFATDKGIVAFDSHIAPYGDHLVSAYAFPNPVRKYHEYVTIDGRNGNHLPYGTNVKILDSAGNLVYETNVKENQEAMGGRVVWDKTNLAGEKVASGIYLVLLTTSDNQEHVMTKIAIIN